MSASYMNKVESRSQLTTDSEFITSFRMDWTKWTTEPEVAGRYSVSGHRSADGYGGGLPDLYSGYQDVGDRLPA
ncbi:MAG: hypothetical protein ABEK59_00190 [Halobacteria archaeon]